MAFRFENPLVLFLFFIIPLYWAIVIAWNYRRAIPWGRLALVSAAITAMTVGLARPQVGHSVTESHSIKSQVFIAFDVSKSMLAEDTPPSRLLFTKAFLQRLLPQFDTAKLAIYPFTLNGYMQLPLTNDWNAAVDVIASLNPSIVSHQGTDLTKSLETLFTHIVRLEDRSKVSGAEWLPTQVLLLSDGETHRPLETSILKYYRSKRIPIHTVAVGTENGGSIPADRRAFDVSFHVRDPAGKTVFTKMDPQTLRTISKETGGTFFPGQFEQLPLLVKTLQQTATLGRLSTQFKVDSEFFPICFLCALIFLLIDLFTRRWSVVLKTAVVIFALSSPAFGQEETPAAAHSELDDESRAVLLFNEGVRELKRESTRKAAELFQESAALTQDKRLRKRSLYNLGNSLMKQMDPSQAIEAYQEAHDMKVGGKDEKEINKRASENMVLAAVLLEEMKKMQQQQGQSEDPSEGEQGEGDSKGPKKFQAQDFDDRQKKKIFDLIASEEQQTMQRVMEGRSKNQATAFNPKPW